MSSTAKHDVPVLIIGAGPVGLALAIELGLRQIPCVVIEERDGTIKLPKASGINIRTMEFCRRWGVVDQILPKSLPEDWPYDAIFVTNATGRELFRFKRPSIQEERHRTFSPERFLICSQFWFDPILRERARALPDVTFRFRTRFEGFTQDRDGVAARVTDLESGRSETVTAQYLIGCDGGPDSAVRQAAGIAMPPRPALNFNLNIFFRAPGMLDGWPERWCELYRLIGTKGSWGNLNPVDGREMWRLTVHLHSKPDTSAIDAAEIVRRAVGPKVDFSIMAVGSWERREVVADRYRAGRVFLAGDAAHQLSTTGGFGMNTGMGDAVGLGWMLAAAVEGWADDDLLDAYEAERRPIAQRNIEESSGTFRRLGNLPGGDSIDADGPEGDATRERFVQAIHDLGIRRQFFVDGVALGYRYDDSPLTWPDGTAEPADERMTYAQTARPGARAPHAWVAEGRSTLDLFGDGFVLLRFDTAASAAALVSSAQSAEVPLTVVDINDPDIARLYERKLVLVRPDGHVAWRGDECAEPDAVIDTVRGAGGQQLRKVG